MLFLVTTDTGFENILMDELRELIPSIKFRRVFSGRIIFEAPALDGLVAALRSRIANNIYVIIGYETGIRSLDDIYKVMKRIDYTSFIEPHESFAIRPERIGEHDFTSIDIGRVAGQAVIDSYLETKNVRLRVNLDNPDIEIYTELNQDRLIVALGITRSSLHRRGYRVFNHPAALKTTIASAMLRWSGWRPGKGVLDPMCGGGTIVIEAALAAKGVEIPCFKLHELRGNPVIDRIVPGAIEEIEKLCSKPLQSCDRVHIGIELNPRFSEGASINAKNAGVDDAVLFLTGDCIQLIPRVKELEHELGQEIEIAVFNPPYGQRMRPKDLEKLYRDTIVKLKENGFRVAVFITSAVSLSEKILVELDPGETYRLYVVHGTLPSYVYKIVFD